MGAVASGIGEKVKWLFLQKYLIFYNLFSQSTTLPVHVSVSSFANLHFFLSHYFSKMKIVS